MDVKYVNLVSLNGNYWQIWKAKMEDLLYVKDLCDSISGVKAEMPNKNWVELILKTLDCK